MDYRSHIQALMKFYKRGSFTAHATDANGYYCRPWGINWNAEQLAKGQDEYQYQDTALQGPYFSQVSPYSCYPRPIDPAYLGVLGRNSGDSLCTMTYLDDPLNAILVSMGVPDSFANGYQFDLRAYHSIGTTGSAQWWSDTVSRPIGGWPLLYWQSGDGPWTSGDYEAGVSAYNGGYSGLRSNFYLPPNPAFSVAVFMDEPNKLTSSSYDYTPAIDIIYGDVLWIKILADGHIHVFQYWYSSGGTAGWYPLQAVKDGSISKNTLTGKQTSYHAFNVITTMYGVAISTSGTGGDIMYWTRPPELVDRRFTPSAQYPKGYPTFIPSAPISLCCNTGNWGFQVLPLTPAHTYSAGLVYPARMFGPLAKLPHDWWQYYLDSRNVVNTAVRYEPALDVDGNEASDSLVRLWAGCYEMHDLGLGWTVPLASADRYMQPVLEMKASMYTGSLTLASYSYMQSTYLNAALDRYAEDGLCGHTFGTPWAVSPIVYHMALSQQAPASIQLTVPEQDMNVVSAQLDQFEVTTEIDNPATKGSVNLKNQSAGLTPQAQNPSLVSWIEDQADRRITLDVWQTNTDEEDGERAVVFKGRASHPEPSHGSRIVTASLIDDVSHLLDGTVDGRTLPAGDAVDTDVYLKAILSAAGLAPEQYENTIEHLGLLPGGPPNWGPGRLNSGYNELLWVPEVGRTWLRYVQDILIYAADAGIWVEHRDTAGGVDALPTVNIGCRWCHSLTRTAETDAEDLNFYRNHLVGPASPGCLDMDMIRSGDAVDGVDYHIHTRASERHTSMSGEGIRQFALEWSAIRRQPLDDYYNRIVVKGPRVRTKGAADQVVDYAEVPESIEGFDTADVPLGYVKELEFNRAWITDYETAWRVLVQLYHKHTLVPRYVDITIPMLPIAKCSQVFAVHGGENAGLNHTKWRIVRCSHHGRPLSRDSKTVLTGIYIGDLA